MTFFQETPRVISGSGLFASEGDIDLRGVSVQVLPVRTVGVLLSVSYAALPSIFDDVIDPTAVTVSGGPVLYVARQGHGHPVTASAAVTLGRTWFSYDDLTATTMALGIDITRAVWQTRSVGIAPFASVGMARTTSDVIRFTSNGDVDDTESSVSQSAVLGCSFAFGTMNAFTFVLEPFYEITTSDEGRSVGVQGGFAIGF
ncbi:MAG: hypothetical protein AAGG50_15305 [Bacteroidota bacterium]